MKLTEVSGSVSPAKIYTKSKESMDSLLETILKIQHQRYKFMKIQHQQNKFSYKDHKCSGDHSETLLNVYLKN